ncbi:Transcription factor [Mycena venus]|uniref:Transcription factor n=1 Tax=Mycena venus TaxID=2733690 RepID=A0A8H7DHE7_9AGAR|nr:Transcription factor [Mycena venus]
MGVRAMSMAISFHLAHHLHRHTMLLPTTGRPDIDELMQNWASHAGAADPPFANHRDLYSTIDATAIGHVLWQSFNFEMDFAPKQVFGGEDRNSCEYMDFMFGNWAWEQAASFVLISFRLSTHQDIIVRDAATHGATFVPVILGNDKTTVSVATGQNEYQPLYMSNGLVHNNVRRAHRNAVTLIGFLAIPKTDRENQDMAEFHTFQRNIFHASLCQVMQSLRPGMTTPEVMKFADGHY